MTLALLHIEVTCEDHLVLVRQRARQISELLKFSLQDQTRIATAVSEVARNAYEHGGGGQVKFYLKAGPMPAFVVRVTDDGPGIDEADLLSSDQWGISGAQRLMDRFDLVSAPGKGTTIEMTKLLTPGAPMPSSALVAEIGTELARRVAPSPINELRHQNQELLQALSEAKDAEKERERLIEDLKRTLRVNELFVGVLGHDLRNPLNSISMTAELLLAETNAIEPSEAGSRILQSSGRMSEMIDQILDFTRIRLDSGLPLNRKEINIGKIADVIISEFEFGDISQTRCERDGDLVGIWDRDRLAQALSNLIGNARKHGVPGGAISVRIDGRDEHCVVVEVHNKGTIPAELLPVIFEPLQGDRSERARTEGLGLGLFITEQIVVAHGGSIDVESNEADGTTFLVRLPRKP